MAIQETLYRSIFEYSFLIGMMAIIIWTLWKFISALISRNDNQTEQILLVVKDNTKAMHGVSEVIRHNAEVQYNRHKEIKDELVETKLELMGIKDNLINMAGLLGNGK